jgi:NADH:ubiquinone oxidoreductase subunit H
MILMSVLCTLSFRRMATFAKHMGVLFDPRSGFGFLKTLIFLFLFVFVRAALPRYRYDRLMVLGWKVLPISLAWFLFTLATLYS